MTKGENIGAAWDSAVLAALWAFGLAFLILARLCRSQLRRGRQLEAVLRQKNDEIERTRSRMAARDTVLKLLVANRALGEVLDHVSGLLCAEMPEAYCAILIRLRDHCHVAAAPGMPGDWLAALASPRAVPFAIWTRPCPSDDPATDSEWKSFAQDLRDSRRACPTWIRTEPIAGGDGQYGAIAVFGSGESRAGGCGSTPVLQEAGRLARIAIQHSRHNEDLQRQAYHDALTGLPNRALLGDRLERTVREAGSLGKSFALLCVDIDGFKQINDLIGHRGGDSLLVALATRIRRSLDPGDTVARVGGDEFCILLAAPNHTAVEETAARVLACIGEPYSVDGKSIAVTASLGYAMFPQDATGSDELQRHADTAMHCAKKAGRNRVQSFATRNSTLDRARMADELRVALRQRLFEVHYQPKIAADGHLGGFEALIRLNHPVHGGIPPGTFIPIAEETGFIVSLGAWVLDEVCRQIAEWQNKGLGPVSVAVNVSPLQISEQGFSGLVIECLRRHSVSPESLELELTESMLIASGEESERQMRELRSLGIRFSIDDFGTGYSSLSYLHRLEVDAIKLDRSFVQSIDTDIAARRLVQAMIGVAEGLGLDVVAEGVETEAQRETLIAAGCPMMQGFLFARPQPATAIEQFLRAASVKSRSDTGDLRCLAGALASGSLQPV